MIKEGIAKEERNQFYQSKYEYYGTYSLWVVVAACLASTTYWFSDCQLFGRVAWETLLPRLFILIPLIPFVMAHKKIKDYRIMIPLCYVLIHGIMWCTIWAIYFLPIKQHANEGFIIMHMLFLAIGLCAPVPYALVAHILVIFNIVITNTFNHYENFDQMLLLGVPCVVGICVLNGVTEKVYYDQYKSKKQVEKAFQHDQLTGAYNRNVLAHIIDSEDRRLMFDPALPTSVVIMDIDLFKRVNDEYGHPAGDKVLIYVAETIRKHIRSCDYLIRWGGEEFVLFLPSCDLKQTMIIAERIRVAIQEGDNPVCPITISAGISEYDGINYRTAISNADQALYAAKATGRNQVIAYGEDVGVSMEGDELLIEI